MTPDQFFSPLAGQSLLLGGQPEKYRGQCVQSVGLYVQSLGINFPAYEEAYLYWDNGIPGYTHVGAGNPIKQGDLIVWRSDFPASPGAGHIDVASQDATLASFYAWDSNWSPPLKLERIWHSGNNNNYIAGYLRRTMGDVNTITPTDKEVDDTINLTRILAGRPDSDLQALLDLYRPLLKNNFGAGTVTMLNNFVTDMKPPLPADVVPYTGPQLFVKKG